MKMKSKTTIRLYLSKNHEETKS